MAVGGPSTESEEDSKLVLESPSHKLLRQETLTVQKLSSQQRKALQKCFWFDQLFHTCGVLLLVLTGVGPWYILCNFYVDVVRCRTDFCYFGNYATFVCCLAAFVRTTTGFETFLHDHNAALIRSGFAFASGPLAWSVWIFRNSFVFHQIDHTTSVFIHLYPAILFWCIRWGGGLGLSVQEGSWPGMFKVCPMLTPDAADACMRNFWCADCPTGIKDMLLHPIIVYLLWVIPHYLYMFVYWGEKRLKEEGKDVLYFYLRTMPAVDRFLSQFPRAAGPLIYLFGHFLSVVVFGALGLVLWHSFALHSLFLLWVFYVSVSNGSSYFFQVFGMKYAQDQLQRHKDKVAQLRSQSSSSSKTE